MAQDADEDLYLDGARDPEPQADPVPEVKIADVPAETASAKDIKRLEKELAAERASRKTSDETARYWQSRSTQTPAAPAKAEPAAPDVDLLEAITSGDKNQVKKALASYGLVDRDEVAREIAQVRSTARTETLLEKDYPALAHNDSPMFKTSARIYQELVKDEPALKNSPKTTLLAARLAEAELIRNGIDPQAESDEPEDEDVKAPKESEPERVRRVQTAAGPRRTPASSKAREGNDDLTTLQKDMIQKFRDAGADSLTEETFRKRANAGVRMGGAPARRAS